MIGMKYSLPLLIILLFFFLDHGCYSQPGFKVGLTMANFSYTDMGPEPDLNYEVDLRPYLGYDIEWVQLGKQKPVLSPYLSLYHSFELGKSFYIRPELSFIQKRVNFNKFEYEKVIYKVKISYL